MKHLAPIDPHCHLRGQEYDVNYAAKALLDMKRAGICAFAEMPNCKPFLTSEEACELRMREIGGIAHDIGYVPGHFIHIGLTTDFAQVRHALFAVEKGEKGILADKTFYTHSTGSMGLLDKDLQSQIWKLKGLMQYRGVSIGHFEDESLFTGAFDPANPISHSHYQNEHAETASVEAQIKNAFDARFIGTFYVAHASSPDTVDFLTKARKTLPFAVAIEATFHHLFLNTNDYLIHGNLVKMNPPLRAPASQARLLDQLLNGKIDIIGTDHAPHPLAAKKSDKPPSGIPALPFWSKGIELLAAHGISKPLLDSLTFHKANELFELGQEEVEVETEYDPFDWEAYGYNPFVRVDSSGVPAFSWKLEVSST